MSTVSPPCVAPASPIGLDRSNPWPGLSSFTEEARGFFFGRERETDELARLVRRETLTVLFGQSGLGKSSLLQAGLFPLLRDTDHLPLYLRLDHGPSSPPLADQVKAALNEALAAAQADAPPLGTGESLWEYFHRKDVDIWSPKNRLLTPVLAFDQFEEIFTLGRADEASRARSRAFLTELAELVENRPPAALRNKFDHGAADPTRFNYDKPSCRVILSLREDFLPDLEGLKQEMPALIHNRLRLRRLNGAQGLEAVTRPAPELLAEGVGERIVEFVSGARGGSSERLLELEVEPALLSVICRELNERRRQLGQAQITLDLVTGNRREILTDFYDRSVVDLPEMVRTFVEDRLLTKSGFRDNVALETALEEPGVTRPLIDTLVARRLLRIEDRLGVQRVELTHDVLAEVIRASRDARQQRIAVENARAAERRTRRRMWVARTIAAGLLVLLVAVTWLATWAMRVRRAEAQRWSRSDVTAANRLLVEGKSQEGLAFLVHAAQVDPENPAIAPRLLTALATRRFAQPHGAPVPLPSPAVRLLFLPNRTDIGVRGKDDRFRVFDFQNGRLLREFPLIPGVTYTNVVESTLWAASEQTIASYDLEQGALRFQMDRPTPAEYFWGASRDRRWFVTRGTDWLAIRDASTGALLARIQHAGSPRNAHFSHDGTRLVTADLSQARIWSVPDGRPLTGPLSGEYKYTEYACFSPDGRLIAIATNEGAQLRDATNGAVVGSFLPHAGRTVYAEFSADSRQLITSSYDRTVKIWEVATGQLAVPPLVHPTPVNWGVVMRGGDLLTSYTPDRVVRSWDLRTGAMAAEPFHVPRGFEFGGGRYAAKLALLDSKSGILRFDSGAQPLRPLTLAGTDTRLGSAWLRDRPSTLRWVTDSRLVVIDAVTATETTDGAVFPEPIAAYAMGRDDKTLLVRTKSGAKQIWKLEDGKIRVVPLENPPAGTTLPRISPDGRLAAGTAAAASKELRLWDLNTGKLLPLVLAADNPIYTFGLQFSADGKWVGAGASRGEARIWEVETGRLIHELKPLRGTVYRVGFSPDGTRIATTDAYGTRLWQAQTGKPIGDPLEHPGFVATVTGFSPDSRWLMTYAQNGTSVQVWDAATGRPVSPAIEHPAIVHLPVFSPDGSSIATACVDGFVRLWDPRTGQLMAEPMPHGADVLSVVYSPDGRFIRTNTRDRGVRIWAVPPAPRGRVPEWLIRLATVHARKSVTEDGSATDDLREVVRYEELRKEIQALPDSAPYAAWGKWLVTPSDQRTLAPGFQITAAEAEARGMIAATPIPAAEPDAPAAAPVN